MPRRRTLHLIDTGGPGGAETVFLELVKGLPDYGWDCLPVVPEEDWLAEAVRQAGLVPMVLEASRRFDVGYLRALRSLARSERIDLVQTHLLGTSVYATLACLATRIPVVCTFHGHPDFSGTGSFGRLKVGLLHRRRNRVVCVSESLRDHARASAGFSSGVEVIHNGIDVAEFAPGPGGSIRDELGLSADTPLVGAVGNVRASKSYHVLLRAFAIVREARPDVRLVIAGQAQGSLYDALRTLQHDLGLTEVARFLGFRNDVPDLLRALDLFVLASSDEGFSLATVQAMATGLPVVATRCGGPEQIVGDSGAALLVPVDDPAALAAAILQVLEAPSFQQRLRAAARQRAVACFSLDRMVSSYAELYDRCLSAG